MGLRLQQGQVWKHGEEFVRVVHLARLEVGYKVMKDLKSGEGTHHHTRPHQSKGQSWGQS